VTVVHNRSQNSFPGILQTTVTALMLSGVDPHFSK